MKRLLPYLLCLCLGCTPQVVVYAPDERIVRAPDPRGVLFLELKATAVWSSGRRQKVAEQASATVVAVQGEWTYAVTCKHAVKPTAPPFFRVKFEDVRIKVAGRQVEVYVLDPRYDLALIRFRSTEAFRPYEIAVGAAVGQQVWAVGWAPVQFHADNRPTRHTQAGRVTMRRYATIGHNAGIRHGFSGGAVLDAQGRLVGVNRLLHMGPSFGYAIAAEHVLPLLATIE